MSAVGDTGIGGLGSRGVAPLADTVVQPDRLRLALLSRGKDVAVVRDFFLGFVRIHILHHAARESIYGVAIMEELRRHGYTLGPGTLYPLLHNLEVAGYLLRENRVVRGKVRKYYRTTPAGQQVLADAKAKIRELVDEVLEGHGPTSLPDPRSKQREGTEHS